MKKLCWTITLIIFILGIFYLSVYAGTATKLLPRLNMSSTEGQIQIYFIKAPQYIDTMHILADIAETYTIPTGVKQIVFSSDGNFYVRCDGSAAVVPTTEIADGTGSFLNPAQLNVEGLSTLSFVASATRIITMAVYK